MAVVLAFFICFLPFHLQRLLATYLQEKRNNDADNEQLAEFSQILFMMSGVLYYFSTTANPLIYNILSRRFRVAFKEVLLCRKRVKMVPKIVKTKRQVQLTPIKAHTPKQQNVPFKLSSPPQHRCFYSNSSDNQAKLSSNKHSPDIVNIKRDISRKPKHFLVVNNGCDNYISKVWSDFCPRTSIVISFDDINKQGASV